MGVNRGSNMQLLNNVLSTRKLLHVTNGLFQILKYIKYVHINMANQILGENVIPYDWKLKLYDHWAFLQNTDQKYISKTIMVYSQKKASNFTIVTLKICLT